MKKRLLIYTILIISIGLLSFFAASVYVTYYSNLNFAKDTVIKTAQIYADLYNDALDTEVFVQAGKDTRVTIITPNGRVLADNLPLDVSVLENHLTRPEIQAAESGNPAAYVRYSDSLGMDLIYYALKVKSGNGYMFIRTAIPVANINSYLFQSLPLLGVLLIIIIVFCFVLAYDMAKRVVMPLVLIEKKLRLLSEGKCMPMVMVESYEEINQITHEIENIAQILQENLDSLRNEKIKMNYILNNIGDGLFVVNEDKKISLINDAMLDIFEVTSDIIGKNLNYLTYEKNLKQAIEDCVSYGKKALFEFIFKGSIYLITIKRIKDTCLTMIVLSNITENRENAKRREEFFANASHELKTPLTAIKGFNELMALSNKDENLRKYINSITRETDRMLSLIKDMLKLSELENTENINPIAVSLAQILDEVYQTVSTVIDEKSILFDVSGDGTITAEPEHIYELVKNLIENAVRYNYQGGRITVRTESINKSICLTITDTGIGIPLEEQSRIFERFYRVEKSRSLINGGTGLGLSIVKHICALYHWKLSLKSKLGIGTEISVLFTNSL